jgi:hypothetical protein
MESHFYEDGNHLDIHRCGDCQKWHRGKPRTAIAKRKFPVVDRELFHLEIGGRATACMWDETYRDERGRAREVRKRVRTAIKLTARRVGVLPTPLTPGDVGLGVCCEVSPAEAWSHLDCLQRSVRPSEP